MENETAGQWYIINTLSQHEKGVRENIEKQIRLNDPEIPVYEVQIPVEKVTETKNGKRHVITRKFFPGYVFVRMELYKDETETQLNEGVWHYINGIKGVSKIGGKMSPDEVQQWISLPGQEENVPQPAQRILFNVGDLVEIVEGPFSGFKGDVKEIDTERGFLRVEIQVFARPTPMELEFGQVEKVVD